MNDTISKLIVSFSRDEKALRQIAQTTAPEERTALIVRLSEERGMPVTPEAVDAFFAQAPETPDRQLSDRELEQVVGGKEFTGNYGDDTLIGTAYADLMYGGSGNDTLYGGSGDDVMRGEGFTSHGCGAGDDYMDGGAGNDDMEGGGGSDEMYGGEGDDAMYGSFVSNRGIHYDVDDGGNYMDGGAGDDEMHGAAGDDDMLGGEGDDAMYGYGGDDSLDGGEGDDILYGGSGNDTLNGGAGDDILRGEGGVDILTGGSGADTFVFDDNDGVDTITDFNPEEDRFEFIGASKDDLTVINLNGNTLITYCGTTVTVAGQTLSLDEVWDLQSD